ncbi:unnamed protein product [Dovyalis caffra]|uniref:Uncharacterized protein n=1 Tax=Dovyalis caffra TaxID=77055 RepID=A0AAV1SRQ3_9ROSI|nr:unnamed protein product [Dovyalis caffra]
MRRLGCKVMAVRLRILLLPFRDPMALEWESAFGSLTSGEVVDLRDLKVFMVWLELIGDIEEDDERGYGGN